MSVTVSFDHDIVDGAPAARFMQNLKKLVECGYQPTIHEKRR
jgi:pyruvate/2-oxoglutarate dehydrogenase complex dihydrolipoamide acyltransferase (E2) component